MDSENVPELDLLRSGTYCMSDLRKLFHGIFCLLVNNHHYNTRRRQIICKEILSCLLSPVSGTDTSPAAPPISATDHFWWLISCQTIRLYFCRDTASLWRSSDSCSKIFSCFHPLMSNRISYSDGLLPECNTCGRWKPHGKVRRVGTRFWGCITQFFSLLTQLQIFDLIVWKIVSFPKPEVIMLK